MVLSFGLSLCLSADWQEVSSIYDSHHTDKSVSISCWIILWIYLIPPIPQRVQEHREQPFIPTYILFLLFLHTFLSTCTFFMQKSLSLSFSNLQFFPSTLPFPATPSATAKVRFLTSLQKKQPAPKSLHFYSYKYRFRAPRSPLDTKPVWPFDWQLSPLLSNTNEIHKHTSNWLESPAQHQKNISGGMAVDL